MILTVGNMRNVFIYTSLQITAPLEKGRKSPTGQDDDIEEEIEDDEEEEQDSERGTGKEVQLELLLY